MLMCRFLLSLVVPWLKEELADSDLILVPGLDTLDSQTLFRTLAPLYTRLDAQPLRKGINPLKRQRRKMVRVGLWFKLPRTWCL
jgi:hypothetical protein